MQDTEEFSRPLGAAERILGREQILEKVQSARKRGLRVAFANGCFDLLHVGHVRYLHGARQLGDMLIVGINCDEQVAIQKGEGRPIVPAAERAEIVASLGDVDYVTVFEEPTVESLLLMLKPDFHVKGADYTEETVPERDVVRSYGGRVVIAGDGKDHSTSALLERFGR
jgi:rfaE bifunctional protein nucleotidyltransferase chain/domain